MAFSNSFHSSAKSHSISSGAALSKVEHHNERGYYSAYYSADKISTIIGGSGLAADVQDFINATFTPMLEEYNARQRRKDRRIDETAFEHFCNNKKLDVAVEAVFQIGDMDSWAQWRTETIVQGKKGEVVLKRFDPDIKSIMDEIYRKQMEAYERIYETHGDEILFKIESHYRTCRRILDGLVAEAPDLDKKFRGIAALKNYKERQAAQKELPPEERDKFEEFYAAFHAVEDIEKRRYRERIRDGQMHIKMINGTVHYDEWSPHAHGISVCWVDGYKTGLSSRVAKAVVINRYALEVIQDRMHEIAVEEIAKHPEIFGDRKLKDKETGRAMNWATEQFIRQRQAQLLADNISMEQTAAELQAELSITQDKITEAQKQVEFENEIARIKKDFANQAEARAAEATKKADAAAKQYGELKDKIAAGRQELEGICKIKSLAERDQVASVAWGELDQLQSAFDLADDFCDAAKEDLRFGGLKLTNLVQDFIFDWERIRSCIIGLVDSIKSKIRDIGIFEIVQRILPADQIAGILQDSLDQTLAGAKNTSRTTPDRADRERDEKNL